MHYRRLTATGEYIYGQGSLDYLSDADAAAQAVKTKLKLLLGEWWEDTQDGLPLFQQILLQRATAEGIQTADLLIKQRILEVAEVTYPATTTSETVCWKKCGLSMAATFTWITTAKTTRWYLPLPSWPTMYSKPYFWPITTSLLLQQQALA